MNFFGAIPSKLSKNVGFMSRTNCYVRVIWKKFQTVLTIEAALIIFHLSTVLIIESFGKFSNRAYNTDSSYNRVMRVLAVLHYSYSIPKSRTKDNNLDEQLIFIRITAIVNTMQNVHLCYD